eukprot:6562835-Lingulodinium_polyedra.AAC.1
MLVPVSHTGGRCLVWSSAWSLPLKGWGGSPVGIRVRFGGPLSPDGAVLIQPRVGGEYFVGKSLSGGAVA